MHRDHKLGLALGVLVVGFAAAFCFPKPTDVDQRLLQLENTAELDADIAQLPVHAYTNADPVPAPEGPAIVDSEPDAAVIVPGGDGGFDLLAGPPEPITTVAPIAANDADHETAAAIATSDDPAATASSSPAGQQYTVQPGDTLSSVAALRLGNHSRYVELFDANREILATPDDLRPGMVLHIPMTNTPTTAVNDGALVLPETIGRPGESTADGSAAEEAVPHAAGSGGENAPPHERPRLFRPAGSPPFLKAQPVSREGGAGLPMMDASENARTGGASGTHTSTGGASGTQAENTYKVRRGDTLEGIAVRVYGDARRVRDILNANGEVVRDPRRLKPGMSLTLPE